MNQYSKSSNSGSNWTSILVIVISVPVHILFMYWVAVWFGFPMGIVTMFLWGIPVAIVLSKNKRNIQVALTTSTLVILWLFISWLLSGYSLPWFWIFSTFSSVIVYYWAEKRQNFNTRMTTVELSKIEAEKRAEIRENPSLGILKGDQGSKRGTHSNFISSFPQELLNKYESLDFLGEGGFAKVFKAKRKSDGKIVAVKIPRIDEKTSRTFIREVSTWLHLDHPNIVKLYDVDILPVPHLEMEYVEGVKLGDKIIRDLDKYPKPVEENTALKLIKGIAEGLAYAHFKGIYHRDLKPLNVLLKSDLTPKITDWGLAKIGTMSSGRSVLGYTPLYAAPEHLLPGKYGHTDARTDIWQLGVIFYELLTGKLPFEGYTYEEIFGKIVDESYKFTPPSEINPELAKYDGIFEKLLAKRKEDRYQSVEEFLKDLENLGEAKKRKAELEKEAEELKKSLSRSVAALKQSKSTEEAIRNRRMVVETLGKLALVYAELNRKAELLNTLNDLKFYTVQNLNDLLNAINTVETLLKENLPVGGDFIERLKVLVHNIKRENEEIVIVKQPPQKEKKSAKKEDCREYPSRVIPIEKARHSLRSKIRAIHVCLDGRWHRLEIPGGYWSQTLRTVAEFLIDKGFRNLQVDRFIEDRPEKLVRGDGAWDKIDGWYIYRRSAYP